MAVAAEALDTLESDYGINDPHEVHGRSVAAFRRLGIRQEIGRLALDPFAGLEKETAAKEMAFRDYLTGVTEMLKTDTQFREYLDVETETTHQVVDNEVCMSDGSPIVPMLETGVESARQAAAANPELAAQVLRCMCDVEVGKRVNELRPGMTLWGLSMEPKKELQAYKKSYNDLGYKEGLTYLQSYSKIDEHTLVSMSFSVDMSNKTLWQSVLKDYGIIIPEGTSDNIWLQYAVEQQATDEQAKQLMTTIRNDYYRRLGETRKRYSVTDYVSQHVEIVDRFFDAYYPALADAVFSGCNNPALQKLARTMLAADISNLKPEIRQRLSLISNSEQFDSESARVIDSIIRYAVVEELRKGLNAFVEGDGAVQQELTSFTRSVSVGSIDQMMALNLKVGVEAGRSYGGCPGNIELSETVDDVLNSSPFSSQQAFGGLFCKEVKDGEITTCPGCGKVVRARVPDRQTIYCTNKVCDLASPDLKKRRYQPEQPTDKVMSIISTWMKQIAMPEQTAPKEEQPKIKQPVSSAALSSIAN